MLRLKKFETKTVEWLTGLAGVFGTQPACWTYIPEFITKALAIQWGNAQRKMAMTGSIQKGIDQSARKIASSRNERRRRVWRAVKSFQRCSERRHGQWVKR